MGLGAEEEVLSHRLRTVEMEHELLSCGTWMGGTLGDLVSSRRRICVQLRF